MNVIWGVIAACVLLQAEPSKKGGTVTPPFRPQRVLPSQPPIVDPPTISAKDVAGQVTDDELVLGVVVDGRARAYPINMLTGPRREIINDTLGNRAIAATW